MKVERAVHRAQDVRGMSAATPDEVASYILNKAADNQVIVGPLVFLSADETAETVSRLVVGTGDADGQYHCDLLFYLDADGRTALIQALAKPGITLHAMDDELAMARRCEACEKSRSTRRRLEEERRCT